MSICNKCGNERIKIPGFGRLCKNCIDLFQKNWIVVIYIAVNQINGRYYVGRCKCESENLFWNKYDGSGKLLKEAYKKYGKEKFKKYIIQTIFLSEYNKEETYWIKEFKAHVKYNEGGYNLANGDEGGIDAKLGSKRTPEQILRNSQAQLKVHQERPELAINMSKRNKGKKRTEEYKKQRSIAYSGSGNPMYGKEGGMKGKKHKPESIEKMKISGKGKHNIKWTEEQKLKVKESGIHAGSNNGMYAKKRTEKEIINISNGILFAMKRPEVKEKWLKGVQIELNCIICNEKFIRTNCRQKRCKNCFGKKI